MTGLTINGTDTETGYGFTLAEAPGWADLPARRVTTAPIIGRQGERELTDQQEQPRKLTIRGMIRGNSVADARAKLDALKLAVAGKSTQFIFSDQPTRYVAGRLDSFTSTPLTGSLVSANLPVEASFLCSDPYFYDVDDAAVMAWYDVGDTLPGETFSVPVARQYFDVNGIAQTAAVNQKRDSHYIGGVRTHLLEKSATNLLTAPRDLTNVAWVKTLTPAKDQTGIDNVANSASSLLATAANQTCLQPIVAASAKRVYSAFVKRLIGSGAIQMTMDGGTTFTTVPVTAGWTKVSIPPQTLANNSFGWRITTSGDKIAVDYNQGEADNDPTSPFANGLRTTETYTAPWPFAPNVPLTLYLKYIEQGTDTVNQRRLVTLGTTEPAPEILLYCTANQPSIYHNNGSGGAVTSTVNVPPAVGDLMELRAVIYADGSVVIGVSKNGAAEVLGTRSAGQAFAAAWTVTQVRFGSAGHVMGLVGFHAMRGEQSMAQLRAATKPQTLISTATTNTLPLGTGVIRPKVTIADAAVNPTITLYNKNGVAVASIALTITTVAGDILEIDMDAKTVKKNGANQVSAISGGDFFSIDPADQANFGGAGPTIVSSSGALSVSYRRTWR